MEKKRIGLKSITDNLVLAGNVYFPNEKPKAIVQIIPSLREHKERYQPLINILTKINCVVLIVDNRGCGESVDATHPQGHIADENGWLVNLQDIHNFSLLIREKFPKLPFYLIGNSFGSLIAHSYLKRYEDVLDGAVFIATPSYNRQLVSAKTVTNTIGKIKGLKSPGKLPVDYNKAIPQPKTPYDYLSYNVDNIDNYIRDKGCGFDLSNRAILDLIDGMQDVFTRNDWRVLKKKLPILHLVGQDDVVADVGSGFKNTLNNLSKAGYECVEANIYENMRHEILNEREMRFVCKDLLVWLNKQITELKGYN